LASKYFSKIELPVEIISIPFLLLLVEENRDLE